MVFLILAVLGIISIFSLFRSKKISNPVFIFCGLWFVIILFASLKLYGMFDYSANILTIIFIGVLSFCVGGFFARCCSKSRQTNVGCDTRKINVNWPVAYFFIFVSFIGMSIVMVIACYFLMTGRSFYDIHGMFNDNDNYGWLLPRFINWIAVPCLYGSVFIALSLMFANKRTKRENNYIYFVALVVIMYVFGSASRMLMGIIVVLALILFQCFSGQIPKKTRNRIVLLLVCACLFILFFIAVRKGTREINTFYAYFSIPVPIFSYWKEWFDSSGTYLYGGATFYGVLSWINFFTSKIGLDLPVVLTAKDYITATQDTWLTLFESGYVYNAFCSIFYYFYMDFGIFGIIIFDLIFGFISYKIYHIVFVNKRYQLLPYYLLIVQCIMFSFVRWQAGSQGFIVELVLILCAIPIKKSYSSKQQTLLSNKI